MKLHTTNYVNTFIEVADDSPALQGEAPPQKTDKKSIALLQFDLIRKNPYVYTSDDIVFEVFVINHELMDSEREEARQTFFSKGQPCLRSSPLAKRYGWGIHYDEEGKMAIYALDSNEYKKLAKDDSLNHLKAMRSKRA